MENKAIISKIDKTVINFINKIIETQKNDHDIKLFTDILNGNRFQSKYQMFKLQISSSRRLDRKIFEEECLPEVFYNEFSIQIRLSYNSIHLMATIFHNKNDTTEGISYALNDDVNSGLGDETWLLPNENNVNQLETDGRNTNLFFDDIYQLLEQNREITFNSTLEPSKQQLMISEQFDELMESATDEQINWTMSNELETEEKINVLKNLSSERKLNILENFEKENIF